MLTVLPNKTMGLCWPKWGRVDGNGEGQVGSTVAIVRREVTQEAGK